MEAKMKLRRLRADARVVRGLVACVAEPYRPIMAHLIVTRRCNLSCGYCHEYDKNSEPVATDELKTRIDHLRNLGTVFVTLTGGETLLHPDILELVAYVRECGMTPVMNSNGYLLNRERIEGLNRAGLYAMQISIDNVEPNETSMKSLRPLLPKLEVLAECASFRVRINTVLGSGSPEDALEVAQKVTELGFDAKCSLVRDEYGALLPLGEEERAVYEQLRGMDRKSSHLSEDFQLALIDEGKVKWKCRSGARYFTVCEDGLVHLCESSYGSPGKALALYGREQIREAFHAQKSCSSECAVAYAHQASRMDGWRSQRNRQEVSKVSWRASSGRTHLSVLQSQDRAA
jgi:MoaA/NifB/PqqE/SkfB family radical SAM enzyme